MNKELLKLINEKQLVSVMNSTKWRRFIDAISNWEMFQPEVRYKCIDSNEICGFSLVWWDEVYEICSTIEWLDVEPIKRERRGRLVADNKKSGQVYV